MKVRNGFVSNSSTTSFCIYGSTVSVDDSKGLDLFKEIQKRNPEEYAKFLSDYKEKISSKEYMRKNIPYVDLMLKINDLTEEEEEVLIEKYLCGEILEIISNVFNVKAYYPPWDDYYCGVSWTAMGEDETKLEFKERVGKLMKMIFGEEIQCGTCEEAWRDG